MLACFIKDTERNCIITALHCSILINKGIIEKDRIYGGTI